MRTIIAGSRIGATRQMVENAVAACGWVPSVVISGTARGADQLGEYWALEHRIPIERYPANWEASGRSAGHKRNQEMARVAEALIAVWDWRSPGTKNMIETARFHGLRVFIYPIS